MRVGKALKLVMTMWHISNHRLSELSGVGKPTIGKLIRGEHQTATWDKVEQLANGLERVHPFAKVAFMAVLPLPEKTFRELEGWDRGHEPFLEREKSHNVAAVMEALEALNLIDQEALEKLKEKLKSPRYQLSLPLTVEDQIGFTMAKIRLERAKREEEEEGDE